MQIIKSTWRRGIFGKAIVGCGSMFVVCIACSILSIPLARTVNREKAQGNSDTVSVTVFAPTKTTTAILKPGFKATATLETPTEQPPTQETKPIAKNLPTPSQEPLPSPESSSTPATLSMILDLTKILDSSATDVDNLLGKPLEVLPSGIGEIDAIPDGGETRNYQNDRYFVSVHFNKKGIARGVTIPEGLDSEAYSLEKYPLLFERLNLSVSAPPDVEAPAGLRWDNYNGYFIQTTSRSIRDSTIRFFKIYKIT